MNVEWREFLYPLGYLAQIVFGWRFIQQWVISERRKSSVVTRSFWFFSLLGNGLLLLHACVQGQFHIGLAQTLNGVISWRNLNLMQPPTEHWQRRNVFFLLAAVTLSVCIIFSAQDVWFRAPMQIAKSKETISYLWHLLGTVGIFLFSVRFWVQWWKAELNKKSDLDALFWGLSLLGGGFTLAYFYRIGDPVNIVSSALGILLYGRNLILIYTPRDQFGRF